MDVPDLTFICRAGGSFYLKGEVASGGDKVRETTQAMLAAVPRMVGAKDCLVNPRPRHQNAAKAMEMAK
jgi:hypothetical protein